MKNHSKSLYNYVKTYTNHSASLRNKNYMIGTLISKVSKFLIYCIKYLIFLHSFIYFDIVNLGVQTTIILNKMNQATKSWYIFLLGLNCMNYQKISWKTVIIFYFYSFFGHQAYISVIKKTGFILNSLGQWIMRNRVRVRQFITT